jgi:NAD+ kinase
MGMLARVEQLALERIGVLAHPLRAESAPVAQTIADALRKRGAQVWAQTIWDENSVAAQVRDAQMVIAIGGDGAMLRAARVCAPHSVPVLGVNMGQLGFLTELGVGDWESRLDDLLHERYWIEERTMIRASIVQGEKVLAQGDALNDVVISAGIARMIALETYIDGGWATTYQADALIIATATGSTAYALAVGGPILPPELHNILIVPVAPHLSMDRPIVLAQGAKVEVIATPRTRGDVLVTVDGTNLHTMDLGQRIRIQNSDYVSRFVRLRDRNYFYRSLLDRLEPRIAPPKNNH